MRILSAVVGFLFYVVMYTVIFYFNAALVGAAVIRLQGGDPTLRDGIRIASQRMGSIVGYAIISATVGMVLRALSRRAGVVGQIVISLVGLAWNIATFLVVPVLVVENVGPIEAIKRSTSVLKKTWGEQLVGNLGMGAAFGMIWLAVIAGGIVLIVIASALKSTALVILAVILMIVAILALAVISSTLNGIYRAALYCYAEHKDTNGLFDVSLLEQAFKQK